MKNKIADLFDQKMTRKQFLSTLGMGLLAIIGLSTVLELLDGKNKPVKQASYGYSSGPYGGGLDTNRSHSPAR